MFRKYFIPTLVVLLTLYAATWYGIARHIELNAKLELERVKELSAVENFEYENVQITGFPFHWKLSITEPRLQLNLANLKNHPKTHPLISQIITESGTDHLIIHLHQSGRMTLSGNLLKPELTLKNKGKTILYFQDGTYVSSPITIQAEKETFQITFNQKLRKETIYDYIPLLSALQSVHPHDIKRVDFFAKQSIATLEEKGSALLAKSAKTHLSLEIEKINKQHLYHFAADETDTIYTQAFIEFAQSHNRHFIQYGRHLSFGDNLFKMLTLGPESSQLKATLTLPNKTTSNGLLDFPNPMQIDIHQYHVKNKIGTAETKGRFQLSREKGFTLKLKADLQQQQTFNKQARDIVKKIVINQLQHNASTKPFYGPQLTAYAEQFFKESWQFPTQLNTQLKFNAMFDLLAGELNIELHDYTLGDHQSGVQISGNTQMNGPKLNGQLRLSFINHPKSLPSTLQWLAHINNTQQLSNCVCLQFGQIPSIELPKTYLQDAKQAIYTLSTNTPEDRNLHIDLKFNIHFNQNGQWDILIKDKKIEHWLPKLALMRHLKKKNNLQIWGQLVKNNHPNAHFNLGRYHLNFRKDYATALNHFKKAEAQGHGYAALKLAIMYQGGLGVTKDINKSASYMQRAAELGCAIAQNVLGVFYERGLGVPRDIDKAIYWYQQAIQQHQRSAQFNLWQIERSLQDKAFIVANGPSGERVVCHEYNKKSIEQMAKALSLLGWREAVFLPEGQPDAIPSELRLYAFETFNKNGIQVPDFETPPKSNQG